MLRGYVHGSEMLQAQVHQIDGQLALQRRQMIMMQRLVKAAAPLHARGIVDNIDFDQYQSSAMAQESRLKTFERQLLDTEQELSALQSQLAELPLDTSAKTNQLRGQIAQLDAQLAQSEAAAGTVLRAPSAGVISVLLVKAGENVTSGQPLLSILPKGSNLEAELLVPSNAIGFVRPGSRVVLR